MMSSGSTVPLDTLSLLQLSAVNHFPPHRLHCPLVILKQMHIYYCSTWFMCSVQHKCSHCSSCYKATLFDFGRSCAFWRLTLRSENDAKASADHIPTNLATMAWTWDECHHQIEHELLSEAAATTNKKVMQKEHSFSFACSSWQRPFVTVREKKVRELQLVKLLTALLLTCLLALAYQYICFLLDTKLWMSTAYCLLSVRM